MFASSKRPTCRASASVNAPFSRPNSSLSISVDGIAAQFTRTIGRPLRRDNSWIREAKSSLPVPVSPRRSTVESVAATCRTCSSTCRTTALRPITCIARSRSQSGASP